MNFYRYNIINGFGHHEFYFEGKWRSGKTMAIMLRRRHEPEASFRDINTGRPVTMVVGTWDMTEKEWARRRVHGGYALHCGPLMLRES